jgi:hypothetical protein
MHGRSITSSRHFLCVRLLRRTARDGCTRYEGLASRRSLRLQRVLRGRDFTVSTSTDLGAAVSIGLAQSFIVFAFAAVVMSLA